jgi:hypothetical protein
VSNARKCTKGATYRNVLTMTGTSPDISNPRFNYDTFGTDCYDTLSSFVQENNPDGLSASDWKDKCVAPSPTDLDTHFLCSLPRHSAQPNPCVRVWYIRVIRTFLR